MIVCMSCILMDIEEKHGEKSKGSDVLAGLEKKETSLCVRYLLITQLHHANT